jgi:hypothetical protein
MVLSVCENVFSARASAFIVMAVDNNDKFYYSKHFPQNNTQGSKLARAMRQKKLLHLQFMLLFQFFLEVKIIIDLCVCFNLIW